MDLEATTSHLPHSRGQRKSQERLAEETHSTSLWGELKSHIAKDVDIGRGGQLGCFCNQPHSSVHLDEFLHFLKGRQYLAGLL